ncbi:hypothetical protein KY290_017386 [Solanum tuberosum]|uniref:Uncharacterized protein n=1 Tax=Solanum tuberosum TaxID=4113 RepID=A0ABQ7VB43_SOLTU|nr:hypothetical protein KY290_017386 [Solanum tuberosum]
MGFWSEFCWLVVWRSENWWSGGHLLVVLAWVMEVWLETGRKWRRKILLSSMESRGKWVVVWRLFWWCFAGKRRK